ncbi:MAG: hypothetical protein RLY16_2974 [Bacteroidota bacterium]
MVLLTSMSGLISNALTILSGLIVARWLMPEQLGLFNSFSIIISYIILLQLGIPSGLSRNFPYYIGQNNRPHAEQLAATAAYWSLALGFIILALSMVTSIGFMVAGNYKFAAGVFVIGISSFQSFFVTKYLKILFRSNNDFNKLATINIINAVISFASIVFVKYFDFYGLCIRAIFLCLSDFVLTWWMRPAKIQPHWEKDHFRSLLKVGMPIYWVANVYSLWPIVQRTIVVFIGGTKALGLLGLALMVETGMNIISTSISSVVFPKMSNAWGKSHRFSELLQIAWKPVAVGFSVNSILVIVGWLALPLFVNFLLPNFVEGIQAAQWSLLVGLISIFSVFSNIYMVVQQNLSRLVSYVTGFVVWLVSLFIFYSVRGFNLINFPQSMCIAYVSIYLVDFYFMRKFSKKFKQVQS